MTLNFNPSVSILKSWVNRTFAMILLSIVLRYPVLVASAYGLRLPPCVWSPGTYSTPLARNITGYKTGLTSMVEEKIDSVLTPG